MRKLYKSKTDKKLDGVCGGLASYLGIDSTIIRIAMIVLMVCSFFVPIVVIYICCMFLIPVEPDIIDDDEIRG